MYLGCRGCTSVEASTLPLPCHYNSNNSQFLSRKLRTTLLQLQFLGCHHHHPPFHPRESLLLACTSLVQV